LEVEYVVFFLSSILFLTLHIS